MTANPLYETLVNQKMAFARVSLAMAKQCADSDAIDQRVKLHACLDAAIAQLNHALGFYVIEVVDQYGLEWDAAQLDRTVLDYAVLIDRYAERSRELAELQSLLRDRSSWLASLVGLAPNPAVLAQYFSSASSSTTASDPGRIQSVDVTGGAGPLQRVSELSGELTALIDRHRSVFVED